MWWMHCTEEQPTCSPPPLSSTECTEHTVDQRECTTHSGTAAPSAGWAVLDVTGSFDQKSGVISAASPPHSFTSTLTPSCIKSSLSFLLISESRWIYWGNNFVECLKKIESYVWRGGGGAQNRSRRFASARSPWQLDLQQPIILNPAFT